MDNDPQGNLTTSFLKDPVPECASTVNAYDSKPIIPHHLTADLHLLGAGVTLAAVTERDFEVIFRLKEALDGMQSCSSAYDYILIDCLPSLSHLHLVAMNVADFILVPVKPAPYALAGMNDLFGTIEKTRKYFNPRIQVLGIVINQMDGRGLVMEREIEETLRETHRGLVFKTSISKRVRIEESPVFHQCISSYDSNGRSAKQFKALAREIVQRVRKASKNRK